MAYLLVQPYDDGRYRYERATVVGDSALAWKPPRGFAANHTASGRMGDVRAVVTGEPSRAGGVSVRAWS